MNMYDIGARIKQRREQIGLTQDELGDLLGLKKSSISKYESGDIKSLDVDMAVRFAKALKCDPVWLSGWKAGDMYVENDVIDAIIRDMHKHPELIEMYTMISKMRDKDIARTLQLIKIMTNEEHPKERGNIMRQNATVPIWNVELELWIYRPYVDGVQKKYTSRKLNKAGEAECKRKYSNALAGNDPSKVRIEKAWPDYLADKASRVGINSGCYVMAESVGRVQILPRLKNRKVSSITEQDWQDVIYKAKPVHKSKAVLSKKYLMNIRGEIKMFCRYAKKKGYIAERPEDLDIPKTAPTVGKQILQTDALRGFLSDSGSDWYIHLWQLMATSGLRPGEAYGLQRSDVENGLITVKRSINKHGTITPGKNDNAPRTFIQKSIDTEIILKQLAMLNENKILSPWLFCDEDGMKPNPIIISHRWDEYRKRFPYTVTQYGLRHTFVSHNQNALPDALMKLLVGHSPKTPTGELYGHFVTGDDVQAARIVSGVFDKIMNN